MVLIRLQATFSNRLNARQSKLFTEFPQKTSLKRVESMTFVRKYTAILKAIWICSGQILRASPRT